MEVRYPCLQALTLPGHPQQKRGPLLVLQRYRKHQA